MTTMTADLAFNLGDCAIRRANLRAYESGPDEISEADYQTAILYHQWWQRLVGIPTRLTPWLL